MDTMEKVIEVQPRTPGKKGLARKTRQNGRVPGILYGHKQAPVCLSLDPADLNRELRRSQHGSNTVFALKGLGRELLAMIQEKQVHPVHRELIHLDFIEVYADQMLTVKVPINFKGRAAGVVAGGTTVYRSRTVLVTCKPADIPAQIDADVTRLKIGGALRVSHLVMPENVTPVADPKSILVLISGGRAAQADDDEDEEAES